MPRVRTFGQRRVTTRVRPSAFQTNAPSPEVFGAGLGRTIASIGTQAFAQNQANQRQAAADARRQADEIASLRANNELATFVTLRRFGEDGQSGWETVLRGDAQGLPEIESEALREEIARIETGLNTDEQRLAFTQDSDALTLRVGVDVFRHVSGQRRALDQEETDAAVTNSINDAIAFANDRTPLGARRIGESIQNIRRVITQHCDRVGLGEETCEQMLEDNVSKAHEGVVRRMVDLGDDRLARVYYDELKSEILGSQRGGLERALELGSVKGESQRAVEDIRARADTLDDQLALARAELEGPTEDEVVRRLKVRATEDVERVAVRSEEANKQAYQTIFNGGAVDDLSSEYLSTLSGPQLSNLLTFEAQLKRRTGTVESDSVEYQRLLQLAQADPEKFVEFDLYTVVSKMNRAEFNFIGKLRDEMRKGEETTIRDSIFTRDQVITNAAAGFGLDLTLRTSDTKEERQNKARVLNQIDIEAQAVAKEHGRNEATKTEIGDATNRILMQKAMVPDAGFLFFDKRLSFSEISIDNVPKAEQQRQRRLLQSQGFLGTDEEVVNAYFIELQADERAVPAPSSPRPAPSRPAPSLGATR